MGDTWICWFELFGIIIKHFLYCKISIYYRFFINISRRCFDCFRSACYPRIWCSWDRWVCFNNMFVGLEHPLGIPTERRSDKYIRHVANTSNSLIILSFMNHQVKGKGSAIRPAPHSHRFHSRTFSTKNAHVHIRAPSYADSQTQTSVVSTC